MNITLSADDVIVRKARESARQTGISLNGFIRTQLKRLAEGAGEEAANEFLKLTGSRSGKSSASFHFDREEAHRR